jgi:hypothetical protein
LFIPAVPVRLYDVMRVNRLVWLAVIVALTGATAVARHNTQGLDGNSGAAEGSFSYRFENPRFYIRVIEIDIDSNGVGQLRFTRGESDEVLDSKIKLLPATVSRIRTLFKVTGFIGSHNEYQAEKDFSHLGWVTLGEKQGARVRATRFNYTKNLEMKELADIFRGIATQEMSLFDIENAERYQPLDLPKQLDVLENDLKLERIAEPERLLAALTEIAADDTQPLIARNQANRIIDQIRKGKFKSPVKK